MKLGIVVGHTRAAKGAHSPFLGDHEYDWNGDLAERMMALSTPFEKKVFLRDNGGIEAAYARSDAWGSKITIELHFNSAHTETATGSGVLYLAGSERGRALARLVRSEIGSVLELADWPRGTGGVATPFQASGAQMRGQSSLKAGRAPAVLIEPFFGSNRNDSHIASSRKDGMAKALVEAAERYFN